MSDSTAAQLFCWLFIAMGCVAMYWQLRADHWKRLFESTSESQFRRYAKEYFEQLSDEEIVRCVPEEFLHGRIVTAYMVAELKRIYGVK